MYFKETKETNTESDVQFQDVYERQVSRVYKICCSYLDNFSDVQDAVQNIFIKFLEKGVCFTNEAHENAWFYLTARNHCLDILKRFWHKKRVAMEAISETRFETAADTNKENLSQKMAFALKKLPYKQKEVLYLYYYEEYSIKEISKLLKRRESTIQSQLAAGRKKLEKLLQKGGSDE